MWWKKNKWKVIVPVLIVIVLAAAFWMGGGAPGLRGWTASGESPAPSPTAAAETAAPPQNVTAAPSGGEESAPPVSETPTAAPSDDPAPSGAPAETAAPTPTPTAAPSAEPTQSGEKDKYLTDPVPDGKPAPVEPQDADVTDVAHTCTISIECSSILDHMDWLDKEKVDLVPEDGWILKPLEVTFYEGESVFNVLQRTCKQKKIHMEFSNTPMYNSAYIEGIYNLYEFDCGELSGWTYKVNDWFPNYGCSRYALRDGDEICWIYTCDLGRDVGDNSMTG